jgi:hypothetical protein
MSGPGADPYLAETGTRDGFGAVSGSVSRVGLELQLNRTRQDKQSNPPRIHRRMGLVLFLIVANSPSRLKRTEVWLPPIIGQVLPRLTGPITVADFTNPNQ